MATSASSVASAVITNGAVRITGVAPGLATITVTATAPASPTFAAASAQRTIRVRVLPAPNALRSIVLASAVDTLLTGATRTLTVTLDAADPTVTVTRAFRSTALAIATVNGSGVVTAVSPGTAQIIVEATGSATGFTTRTVSDTMQLVVQTAPVLGIGFADAQFAPAQGGEFTMGNANGQPDEVPVRVVRTNPVRMQRTEVTQSQWREIMQGTAIANPDSDPGCGATCPVEAVSWLEVQEFITRLNARYPGKGYRLPTEAEWEQWAKAGSTGDYGGNGVLNDMGWWSGNSGDRKHPVAQKLPNAWGLYDMHGNVWEWTSDWYGPYDPAAVQNPTGPATGTQRARRGGAFDSSSNSPRSSNRGFGTSREYNRGFRLVLPVPLV